VSVATYLHPESFDTFQPVMWKYLINKWFRLHICILVSVTCLYLISVSN
jgi:hypothetical protein